MSPFEERWREEKRRRIETFEPFGLVRPERNLLWAPAWIKNRWEVLELDLEVARQGAMNVLYLCGDGKNVASLVKAAISSGKAWARLGKANVGAWLAVITMLTGV